VEEYVLVGDVYFGGCCLGGVYFRVFHLIYGAFNLYFQFHWSLSRDLVVK